MCALLSSQLTRTLLDEWQQRLANANGFEEIISVAHEICRLKSSTTDDRSLNTQELTDQLCSFLSNRAPVSVRKVICKAYFRLMLRDLDSTTTNSGESFDPAGRRPALSSVPALLEHTLVGADDPLDSTIVYGLLQSKFLAQTKGLFPLLQQQIVTRTVEQFTAYRVGGFPQWYGTVIENLIALHETRALPALLQNYGQLWPHVLVNLDSPYVGVRESTLKLLRAILGHGEMLRSANHPQSVASWSWLNRNKFHIVALLIEKQPYALALESAGLRREHVAWRDVLEVSLQHKHLLPGGQALLRALYSKQPETDIVRQIRELLTIASIADCIYIVRYWLHLLAAEHRLQLYHQLHLDTAVTEKQVQHAETTAINRPTERLFILFAYGFRVQYEKHIQLAETLSQLCEVAGPDKTRTQLERCMLMETFAHHAMATLNGALLCNGSFHPPTMEQVLKQSIRGITLVTAGHVQSSLDSRFRLVAAVECKKLTEKLLHVLLEFHGTKRDLPTVHDVKRSIDEVLRTISTENDDPTCTRPAIPYSITLEDAVSQLVTKTADLLIAQQVHRRDFYYAAVVVGKRNGSGLLATIVDELGEWLDVCRTLRDPAILPTKPIFENLLTSVLSTAELAMTLLTVAKSEDWRTGSSVANEYDSLLRLLNHSPAWNVHLETIVYPQEHDSGNSLYEKALNELRDKLWQTVTSSSQLLANYGIWLLQSCPGDPYTAASFQKILFALVRCQLECIHPRQLLSISGSLGRMLQYAGKTKLRLMSSALCNERKVAETIITCFESYVNQFFDYHSSAGTTLAYRNHRGFFSFVALFIRNDLHSGVAGSFWHKFLHDRLGISSSEYAVGWSNRESLRAPQLVENVGALEMHLLALLAEDASLTEVILERIDELLILALVRTGSARWIERNAAISLWSTLVTKLTGLLPTVTTDQMQCDWVPLQMSLDLLVSKIPHASRYILLSLQQVANRMENRSETMTAVDESRTLVPLLSLLARVEYRGYGIEDVHAYVVELRALLYKLLPHINHIVRQQIAICLANAHDGSYLETFLVEHIPLLFTIEKDQNFRHGLCLTLLAAARKFKSHQYFLLGRHTGNAFSSLKSVMETHYRLGAAAAATPPLPSMANGLYRSSLADLLCYLGFIFSDDVVQGLLGPFVEQDGCWASIKSDCTVKQNAMGEVYDDDNDDEEEV
uniref:tRNA (32-2'-O)-methyltransferase regulator THADA-like C-terminal TPR repeats region domain-containing protein n=1 Tax=Anopheles marajoara TaxID=58244 RepID=A0A2M4BAI6_9DIPT